MSQGVTRRTRVRHRRFAVAFVIGVTAVGATAATALILTRTAENPTVLTCYSSTDVATAVQVALQPDAQLTPIAQCGELWSDGRLSSNGPPQLVACVTDADIVAVLPGDATSCADAGWTVAAPPTEPVTDRTSELTTLLSDRFVDRCLNAAMATKTVEDVLAELGLTGWTIDDRTTTSDACVAPVVDVSTRSIGLISLP
jgi:hypothetical protein